MAMLGFCEGVLIVRAVRAVRAVRVRRGMVVRASVGWSGILGDVIANGVSDGMPKKGKGVVLI